MKKYFLLLLLCAGVLYSCNENGSPILEFLNTTQLSSQTYQIDINRDTVLHTLKGADIRIAKGSISSGKSIVALEIKEAYSMTDMVKAGLVTQSGDKPLSSGGMIQVKATEPDAKIMQPIAIHMPSDNANKDMQLFKGEEKEDGTIDWIDPQPLQQDKRILDTIAMGKAIFMNNCSSCHHIDKDATGPPLAFIAQRRDRKWLKQFIHNSAKMIAEGDPLANCIYEHWNKTAMTAFPNLSDAELDKLYRYLDEESKQLNPAQYPDFKASVDSCAIYLKARFALDARRDSLIQDSGPEVRYKDGQAGTRLASAIDTQSKISFELPENLVVPKYANSTYYQFTISAFGWYNVDVFTKNLPGYEASVLKVKLDGAYTVHSNVYLVVPDAKIFVSGGLLKGEKTMYGFYTDEGNVPLPQGQVAYILAFTEEEGKITFGIQYFVTARESAITVRPQPVTREAMNSRIRMLDFKTLDIQANDARNAGAIRKMDVSIKNLESLRPKGSDCNCHALSGYMSDTASDGGISEISR